MAAAIVVIGWLEDAVAFRPARSFIFGRTTRQLVGLIAAAGPLRRGLRIQPSEALRTET